MPSSRAIPRKSLFDGLPADPATNLYCNRQDLHNEASVEMFFVNRLLKDLGYRDSQIRPKEAISEIVVAVGSKRVNYKPDYVLTYRSVPRWVLDAKATDESLAKWVPQCSGYCLALNQEYEKKNPVEFFVLTNGILTQVYQWDVGKPLLELSFSDFTIGNPKYEQLRALFTVTSLRRKRKARLVGKHDFLFKRATPEEAKRVFALCHRAIWKSEVISPIAAFMEFTKLVFIKLWLDRKLREDTSTRELLESSRTMLPRASVTFSTHWIEENEKITDNPVNDVLFKQLRDQIERDIAFRKKKRIFDRDETINLRPDTIKAVVRRLEHYDLFGIDEDLNGRLFETFLSATMRGKALGQFFTPRSVVRLMVCMADLCASRARMDTVVDACCGTGGFLIEALSDMRDKIRANRTLTDSGKRELIDRLSNESVYGIDFGKSPPIARIARINMYLHGDGGSRIYFADALDKDLELIKGEEAEVLENIDELRGALAGGMAFQVALTNPPFSMTKELANEAEARILKQYDLALFPGTARYRSSLRSSAMFVERYRDLLAPGGRLFTVIDDTLLASDQFRYVRNFIRKNFIVRAIVSLPGDAFRRQGARVKTSVLCLEKKITAEDEQPEVFYAFAYHLGVDDLTSRASNEEIAQARRKADAEIDRIASDFIRFLDGDTDVDTVTPDRIQDRLDLKFVVPLEGRFVTKWGRKGIAVKRVEEVVEVLEEAICPQDYPEREFTLIYVSYEGFCEVSERRKGKEIKPTRMLIVRAGDIVFSNIRATDGAVGIVPEELDGALVSDSSFTVLRCTDQVDTVYLWCVLRSHEIRADLMSVSTGTSRYNTAWENANQVKIPWLDRTERDEIAGRLIESWELERRAASLQEAALDRVGALGVESEDSRKRYEAYRPPK
jgi:type I restriction enzyme M protein